MQELAHLPWLVGGDFNEILLDNEKIGGRPKSLQQMIDFLFALDECGLRDLLFKGDVFTWANKHSEGGFVQERLDKYVGNLEWR